MPLRRALALLLAALVAPITLHAQQPARDAGATAVTDFAIVDVRVFDGERVLPRATVVVRDGRIASVSARRPARLPASVIDGRGRTLLPGLIEAHGHTHGMERALSDPLRWGTTTVIDLFGQPTLAAQLRALRGRSDLVDTRAAGTGATQSGGHGTQYGYAVPTISTPDSAEAFVAARVAEGSELLKIIISRRPHSAPALDSATVAALVAAAHRRGMLAVAHVDEARDADLALRAGVDGLVHVWRGAGDVPAVAALAASRRVFVIPTMVVFLQSLTLGEEGRVLLADPRVSARLDPFFRRGITESPWVQNLPDSLTGARRADPEVARRQLYDAVGGLRRAGVRILAGSDYPNRGMSPVFLHRELELLVAAGLTPVEVLTAATAAPADAFRLTDRGRIRPGLRADLLLVDGDPTRDITATRGVVAAWKAGVRASAASGGSAQQAR